ncbi:hypothetical protein [Streptomyces antibioticus]|uniref:hypothetical protein n=1 Tax=Streptomyces antibioticus TaxID=1890 RepID=UPI001FD7BAA6|nr:hypothetical protein [Streptomyces antibioticus]
MTERAGRPRRRPWRPSWRQDCCPAAPPPPPPPPSSSSSSPSAQNSPSPTPPEALCTRLVVHWAREILGSGTYGDYQSMGLSNGQYEILRSVVDEARVEHKRREADAADELIRREARTGCAAWYRSGGPGAGAWR